MSSENKASIKETDKLIVITGNKTSEGIFIKKNALIGYQITGGPPESITLILSHQNITIMITNPDGWMEVINRITNIIDS